MAEVKGNQVITSFPETRDVLSLAIGLIKAVKLSQEDGEINWADITNFLPVLFLVGPAIDNIEGVEPEFMLATPEQSEELKTWVRSQVEGLELDEDVSQFIQDAFGLIMQLWMMLKKYIFTGTTSGTTTNYIAGQPESATGPKSSK